MPVTGGSNIPALNYLLGFWGVALSDGVYEGDFTLGDRDMYYATGTSLAQFPREGTVVRKTLNDHAKEMLEAETESVQGMLRCRMFFIGIFIERLSRYLDSAI